MLVLNKNEIDGLLDWPTIIDTCEKVFQWIDEGEVVQEHLSPMYYSLGPGHKGFALPFPACIKPLNVVGNKWGGGSRQNRSKGLPSFIASIILNHADTAQPFAIMDGTCVTSMRTGGHAALGAKYLARPDSQTIAVIGCGAEGGSFLCALNTLFDLQKVNAVARHPESARRYAEKYSRLLDLEVEPFGSAKDAVAEADIICMCTSADKPVVSEEWIKPGTHVAATRAFIDYDPIFSKTADKWVLGNRDTDLRWLKKPPFADIENLFVDSVYTDLVDIIAGRAPGREHDDERTIMTHMGMGALDIAVGYEVYKRAVERDLGKTISLA